MPTHEENGKLAALSLPTRVALLEARVRLIVLLLKGFIALVASAIVAYIIGKLT